MRPKIEMTDQKAELLLRSALLEDATNINERFAAISAEISLDDDEIWVTLDMDLWPEDKEPTQAIEVAKMLWLEVEWQVVSGNFPFAWPGLGEHTNVTTEYFRMVLDAHAGRTIIR